jgi:succinate dehydrogenase/fumarate reductase cytochrome b subunit
LVLLEGKNRGVQKDMVRESMGWIFFIIHRCVSSFLFYIRDMMDFALLQLVSQNLKMGLSSAKNYGEVKGKRKEGRARDNFK